ncbi:hypothetical protein CYMTET_54011 [Cymbomonas tetramitiformis]|uniref:Apple domain-containing protein n=1 Tax=Cymbomonas tetramitiformis TaxID=36881 RepID=A0AAE0EPS9_9CHLO|nr:hypothetical protein CYMTET_54011 [Cymbomonas tetramitiformis]
MFPSVLALSLRKLLVASALVVVAIIFVGEYIYYHPLHLEVRHDHQLFHTSQEVGGLQTGPKCGALTHVEYDGFVVRWGSDHLMATPAACCEACANFTGALERSVAHPELKLPGAVELPCNAWVHCGEHECGDWQGQCWLKYIEDSDKPPVKNEGSRTPWTSGLMPHLARPYLERQNPLPSLHVDAADAVVQPVAGRRGAGKSKLWTADCHSMPNTELDGFVVRWGSDHLLSSAAACCEACRAHRPLSAARPCNIWVFCGDKARCKEMYGQCWLKSDEGTVPNVQRSGEEVPWTSGMLQPTASEQLRREKATMRENGVMDLQSGTGLLVGLRQETGTIAHIGPLHEPGFSYVPPLQDKRVKLTPPTHLDRRAAGFHHFGDITFRARQPGRTAQPGGPPAWATYSTVPAIKNWGARLETSAPACVWQCTGASRSQQGLRMDPAGTMVELTTALSSRDPGAVREGPPVRVQRWMEERWLGDAKDGVRAVVMQWSLMNPSEGTEVELGSVGLSMPMNQDFSGRNLPNVATQCSFVEAYVGGHMGYVQVTKASGEGQVLLLVPQDGTSFEAWRPLEMEDATERSFTFEGHHEMLVHSKAYVEQEWTAAQPWNPGTGVRLPAGKGVNFTVAMLLADSVEDVESMLLRAGHAVAMGVPGTIVHADMTAAALYLRVPHALRVSQVRVEPKTALTVLPASDAASARMAPQWQRYRVVPTGFKGRARVIVHYTPANGSVAIGDVQAGAREQAVHYFLHEAATRVVRALGTLGSTRGWLNASVPDPWGRSPAFFGFDMQRNEKVMEEPRVCMSGLSDESGAGASLSMAMKQLGQPSREEVAKLEEYVHGTLFAGENGDRKRFLQDGHTYGARA